VRPVGRLGSFMATQDNDSGLLSKVARFVLNPTVDWEDLNKLTPTRTADSGKLALKQMIERKQYNDAVRKREFDKLRKLRLAPTAAAATVTGATVSGSAFQDSWGCSVFEERANTLKKIDEIEAQMSRQWWKGHPGADPTAAASAASAALRSRGMDSAFATTMPSDLVDDEESIATQMGAGVEFDADHLAPPMAWVDPAPEPETAQTGAAADDATLEEAAIRFANSDDGGAESVLLAALQTNQTPAELAKTWASALLDIYRATGQQLNFERMAADYAKRFNTAAPGWAALGQPPAPTGPAPTASTPAPQEAAGPLAWRSPATLDTDALLPLPAFERSAPAVCWLDWRALKSISPPAGQALTGLLARWCMLPLKLDMPGVDALAQLLSRLTPVGDMEVPQFWWQLRLDLLRLMRLPDEFDQVALDFCVTYEISPPSWQPARCQIVTGNAPPTPAAPPPAVKPRRPTNPAQPLRLAGEILGDATLALDALQAAAPPGQVLVVSCAELVRVDFSAAGSMLNWLAQAQEAGVRLELHDVPHLVAAFFHLIGINEHARVMAQTY